MKKPNDPDFPMVRPGGPDAAGARARGFSLLELLVAISVLALMMVLVLQMVDAAQQSWSTARSRTSQFREAQVGFEAMTRRISQATLNTYLTYDDTVRDESRDIVRLREYVRQSELHFVSGESKDLTGGGTGDPRPTHSIFFQAPFGYTLAGAMGGTTSRLSRLSGLMNGWGYYVEYNSDRAFRPPFLESVPNPPPERFRFRLMEYRLPTEYNPIYLPVEGGTSPNSGEEAYLWNMQNTDKETYRFWFTKSKSWGVNTPLEAGQSDSGATLPVRVVAENIIALIVHPKAGAENQLTGAVDPEDRVLNAGSYYYDSRQWQWKSGGNHQRRLDDVSENSKNVLPPLIDLTMVAVDEESFQRYQLVNGMVAPTWTQGLFVVPSQYEEDLDALENRLIADNMNFRTFRTSVPMRESKWDERFR